MNRSWITTGAIVITLIICALLSGCTGTTDEKSWNSTQPVTESPATGVQETVIIAENAIDANNLFAFDIYKKIASDKSQDENIFFSPFSISSALAIAYEGAEGKTAEEIKSVLHLPDDNGTLREDYLSIYTGINAGDPEYELSVANGLWAEKTYKFLDDYISTAEDYYFTETVNLDFVNHPEESRVTINEQVAEKTKDRIKDLIEEGMIDPLTRFVITNAIYFRGTWDLRFEENGTYETDFTTTSGEIVKVDMMKRTDGKAVYGYAETKDFQVLKMPYEHESGKELSMLVLLPKEKDLGAAEVSLNGEMIKEIQKSIKSRRVIVHIPRFRLETGYRLADTLKAMGMPTAFTGTADFSGMDGTGGLYIGQVLHKAFVEVDEEGTEAAAATAVVVHTMAGPPDKNPVPVPVFRADHPFVFLIQDDETGNILFIGRISNPAGE